MKSVAVNYSVDKLLWKYRFPARNLLYSLDLRGGGMKAHSQPADGLPRVPSVSEFPLVTKDCLLMLSASSL